MPIKSFVIHFAGDINKVIVEELNARFSAIENASAVAPMTTRRGGMRTVRKPGMAPATVARTTRKRARDARASIDTENTVQEDAHDLPARSTRARTRTSAAATSGATLPLATPAAHRVPFTPLPSNTMAAIPAGTVLRNPKRGEIFFSKNGELSPAQHVRCNHSQISR